MNNGNLIIRIGFALLFIWGGVEKFIEGFLGGVGLENMAAFLASSGLGFLGDSGTYVLAAILAAVELVAGISLLLNKKLFYAYLVLAFIMFMALVLAYVPAADWMMIMIHIALTTSLLGMALNERANAN